MFQVLERTSTKFYIFFDKVINSIKQEFLMSLKFFIINRPTSMQPPGNTAVFLGLHDHRTALKPNIKFTLFHFTKTLKKL